VFTAEYNHYSSLKLIVSGCFETSNTCQPLRFTPLKVAGNLQCSQSLLRLVSHNVQIFGSLKPTSFISRAEKVTGLQNGVLKSCCPFDLCLTMREGLLDIFLCVGVLHFRTAAVL
jgi:hypothetical protein